MSHICCLPFLLWPLMIHICCGLLSSTTPRSICTEPQKSLSSFAPQITLLWQEELKLCSGSKTPLGFSGKETFPDSFPLVSSSPSWRQEYLPIKSRGTAARETCPFSLSRVLVTQADILVNLCKKCFLKCYQLERSQNLPTTISDFDSSHIMNVAKSQC